MDGIEFQAADIAVLTSSLRLNFVIRGVHVNEDFNEGFAPEFESHYRVPQLRFVVRTRVLCQAGRARAARDGHEMSAWLCERAPLWVVVHVCALLRDWRERYDDGYDNDADDDVDHAE